MKKLIFAIAISSMTCGAQAQQATPQTAESRAFSLRIGQEVNANLQCSTQVFSLQDKLTAAEAEVRRLTDKYEPKNDPPK